MEKRKFLILFSVILFLIPFVVFSQISIEPPGGFPDTIEELIDTIINFIFFLALALAPLMVLIGAFYIMTAAGNPDKVRQGTNIILYTAIGFGIILFAKGLISMVRHIIGSPSP